MALTQISTSGIKDATIATADIAADAITGALITDDAVGAEHIEVLDAALQLADDAKIQVGTGNDLEIYHSGDVSRIRNTNDSGTLKIQATSNGENAINIVPNGTVELYFNGLKQVSTTSTGITFGDDKRIDFGDGADLRIYHDATDSYIQNNTGVLRINNDGTDLVISTDDNVHIRTNGTEEAVKAVANGTVELYYDNVKKFYTGNSGVAFVGNIYGNDSEKLILGTGGDLEIYHDGTNNYIDAANNHVTIIKAGTSDLFLQGNPVLLTDEGNSHTYFKGSSGGAAELYHDNSKKLETTADGVEVTGSLVSSNISGRNLVINGAMDINQYAASSTYNGIGTVDRWRQGYGGENEDPTQAKVALTSSDTGPWAEGFRNCFQITNGNQTSVDAADFMYVGTALEGFDIASSGWDYTSTSSYLTLTFWVKSSVAQNFYGYLCMSWDVSGTHGSRKTYTFQTGSLSANTWTKITKVIPGHADIKVDFNEKKSMALDIVPFYGTSYTDNSIGLDAWVDKTSNWMPDNTDTWWDTNDATFAITGVQLELGKVATPFDHVPYHQELLRCYRYYQNSFDTALGDYPGAGETEDKINLISWADGNAIGFHFFTEMRSAPTVTLWNGSTSGQVNSSGTDRSASAVGVNNKSIKYLDVTSGANTSWVDFQWEAKTEIV